MNDARGLVGLKTLVVLVVLGVALFDAGAIVIARFQVDDVAIRAADVAANEYSASGSSAKAEERALEIARECSCTLRTPILIDDRSVHVTLEKRARTLVAHRISSLRSRARVSVTHRGKLT